MVRAASMAALFVVLGGCGDQAPKDEQGAAQVPAASVPSLPGAVAIPRARELPTLGPSLFGLELDLEGQAGQPVSTESLKSGGPLIVSMFYATCSYACPTLIRDLAAIDRLLGSEARARTRVLLVTFDPEHDTPAVLTGLAKAHGVPADRWTFARARSEGATRELAAALGITYRRLPDGNYNHTSLVFALDKAGVPRARIDGLAQDPTPFVAAIEALARE